MKAKDAAKLLITLSEIYPDLDITFANNKAPVTKIVYDSNSQSVNFR